MHNGKVNEAVKLISDQNKGGILPLTPEVIQLLHSKHPPAEHLDPSAILDTPPPRVNPIMFAGLTADVIRKSSIATHGEDADQ